MPIKRSPPGRDGTLPELCRLQPFVNGAQSRKCEADLYDLSAHREGDHHAGTEMVASRRVHGELQL